MSALTVRAVTEADAGQLPPLFEALSHPATVSQLRVRLARLCSDPMYEAWVAADGAGLLVGFAAGHLVFPVEDDTPAAQLIALVSAPTARSQGVGTGGGGDTQQKRNHHAEERTDKRACPDLCR